MNGARVGITAGRRAGEQAALVAALGGVPVRGAAVHADAPGDAARVADELGRALAEPLDLAIFLTGVGAELATVAAQAAGRGAELAAALAGARVVARGPKPRAALRARGVRVDQVVEPALTEAVREELLAMPLRGRRVLLQGYGAAGSDEAEAPTGLAADLRAAGAEVHLISPYAAGWPRDPGPATRLAGAAAAGRLDALAFTSAGAAERFLALARAAGVASAEIAAGGVLVAAVGPVTRRALVAAGLAVHVEPERPRMGAMYRALAAALAARRTAWEGVLVAAAPVSEPTTTGGPRP